MSRYKEVPGNVLATQAVIERAQLQIAGALMRLEYAHQEGSERDPWMVSFRVKFPEDESSEYFVIINGDSNDGKMVAFHSATGLGEAIRGMCERYLNGNLKWRRDEFGN